MDIINHVPARYIPKTLSKRDKEKQIRALRKSRKMYKKKQYFNRPTLKSFKSKSSPHIQRAKQLYGVESITASKQLAKKTRCSVNALQKIISKGEGAFFSSGSRPNQTSESWARARLASSITGGPASKIDYRILETGCKQNSPALNMAIKPF
jgi:hypothetical protein